MAVGKKVMELLFRVKSKEAKQDIKEVGDGLGNVGKKGKIAQGGLNLMSKGFKGIGVAMKAAGIGLFIGLLSQLTGLFQSNQKTADTFQRILIKLRPVFDAVGKVIEFVATVLETLIDLFTGAIGWIGDLIGVTNSATSASDDFAESLVNQRKKVQLLESELAMLQLQYQREAELMRQIRDDEARTIDERIQANYELGKVLEEQLRHERNIAEEFLQLAEMELSVNKDNIELQKAVIDQKVKLAEIDERITGQRSEQLVNLNSLEREREAQQKEASAKREEQLKAEAEMLQELIDLQNEDIKVTKEKFRTINEQFDNAEKQNQKQLEELNRQMNAELKAHETKVKNAKENIDLKNEEVENFKQSNEDLIQSDLDRAESFSKIANTELAKIGQFNPFAPVEDMDDFQKAQEKAMEEIAVKMQEFADDMGGTVDDIYNEDSVMAFFGQELVEEQEMLMLNFATARKNILKETEQTGDAIVAITDEQIQMAQDSANQSISVVENSAATKLAIQEKYAKKIEETEKSLDDTTLTLQQQADQELFLHFETAKEKEIRETEEKYDRLLGLALNNAEDTKLLEEEKEAALKEIREREGKQIIQDTIDLFARLKLEKEKRDDEKDADDEKKAEEQAARNRKTVDNAVGMMNALLSISKTKSEKEKKQLDKDLAKGLITEKQYNKKLQQIEEEQLRKEKQAALIQIGVDTARGISGAVQAGANLAFPANLAAISTGILAVLAGVAQAAGVLGQTVDAGSSDMPDDDTSDLGGDVPRLPTFGAITSDAPPVQAYVVETDVSNAQALQGELDLQSTL